MPGTACWSPVEAAPVPASHVRAGATLPSGSTTTPVTLLVAVPMMGPTVGIVDIKADARIIEVAVPAERIVSSITDAVIRPVAIAIIVRAIAAIRGAVIAATVAVGAVHVVGAGAKG